MKRLTNLLMFLIPLTITYAIVSSVGTTGNYYHSPNPVDVPDQGLQKPPAN